MASKTTNAPATSTPAASAPATDSLDTMFGPNIQADAPAPLIEREHLKAGAVVQHKGTLPVKTRRGMSVKHSFAIVGAPKGSPWFSLWGSANLNSQLRKAKPGAVLFLRYAGQDTNPDQTPGAHQWDVKLTTATVAQLQRHIATPERQAAIRELLTVVERTQLEDRERRDAARTGDGPLVGPEHDDDDLPF